MPVQAVLKPVEHFDETARKFVKVGTSVETVVFEHSLVSISLWEARWHRAFLTNELTRTEQMDYVGRCMVISETNLTATEIFVRLTVDDAERISGHIKDKHTATVVTRLGGEKPSQNRVITSELIYYYMVELNIPIEFERWHLNRLLTFIDMMSLKREEQTAKDKPFKPNAAQNQAKTNLNAARLAQYKAKAP